MSLPFGLKAPSRGTLIFSGIAGALSGIIYTSNQNAEKSRRALAQRVQHLAERPCGVHEMPRKVTVYISAPPGDSLEKSRNWFREYVKPVLVAGAIDYEVKEAKEPGQVESSVIEEVVKQRREASEVSEKPTEQVTNPFINLEILKKPPTSKVEIDGILAIGRNAYREVLNGLAKGCEASLLENQEKWVDSVDQITSEELNTAASEAVMEPLLIEEENKIEGKENTFSLPPKFSPVIYIPHINIIGWSNIPYRLYMWYADYKRIEDVGEYVVAAVLNQTRPIETKDADKGQEEKKYWIGDEKVEELKENDPPIVIDERIIDRLSTYIMNSDNTEPIEK
ncbi:hypothetical protein G6F37_008409 [Rhizopus arrhizus]|nr:hypothetical protein G6F38_008210 [Rhizopus arrhizus]KAG1155587.1 hypothetical protein G6F37_008409 [Rhizopus arrhizus]